MSVTESKAKAPVKTSKKSVNPAESAALKAALEAAQVEMVPLSALVKSPLNVRTIPYAWIFWTRGRLSAGATSGKPPPATGIWFAASTGLRPCLPTS